MTDKEYEEGVAGTNKNRESNSLMEYSDNEPMTSAKLNMENTWQSKEPSDRQINSEDKTRTSTEQASKEYQKKRYTRIENDS